MGCEKIINLQQEGGENILNLEREMNVGGAVKSVNGMTGDVVLNTSDLENTSDYQTGSEVESAISTAVGAEATLRENADTALGGRIDNLVTGLGNEITARQTADNSLQGQIDAITASSDVTDIVGTKAQLNNYDTSKLNDNDIIKVLQDESQNDETTYYRWSTATQSFSLIGEEGPYYTKAESNVLLQAKQDVLTAGTNININNNVISATDTTYSAGNAITIDANNEISAGIYPADYFTADASTTKTGTEVSFDGTIPASMSFDNLYGNSEQQTYTGKNLVNANGTFTYGNTNYRTTSNGDGTITTTSKIGMLRSAGQKIEGLLPNTVYTLSATLISYDGSLTSGHGGQMEIVDSSSGSSIRLSAVEFGTIRSLPESGKLTFTTPADVSAIWVSFNGRTTAPSSSAPYPTLVMGELQLEKGSTVTSYEPYVGGISAPNPQYPQDVHTVTGEQTVTVSDGTNSQSYTVDLGTIELCKIGDYQDYIYKSGNNWYVHKDCGKIEFDGSNDETWSIVGSGTPNFFYAYDSISNYLYTGLALGFICSAGVGASIGSTTTATGVSITNVAEFRIRYGTEMTLADWKSYLSSTPMSVYYRLATPSDTQITDASLISQLNTLDTAHSYAGETNIVISATGTNLPAIAKVTATKNSASGIVKELENAVTPAELDSRLGGLTLLPISQTDYDALSTKDPNTLYVITGA